MNGSLHDASGNGLTTDQPIPYRLTPQALKQLDRWRAEPVNPCRDHDWRMVNGLLVCHECGDEKEIHDPYLGTVSVKRRND